MVSEGVLELFYFGDTLLIFDKLSSIDWAKALCFLVGCLELANFCGVQSTFGFSKEVWNLLEPQHGLQMFGWQGHMTYCSDYCISFCIVTWLQS